jgi:hypothetical protein
MSMTTDWQAIRANRFSTERPDEWPPNVRAISMKGAALLGVDTVSNKLYWDGKEIVLRESVRLDWPERILAILVAIGTFGVFVLELCRSLWPVLVRMAT